MINLPRQVSVSMSGKLFKDETVLSWILFDTGQFTDNS